MIQLLLSSLIQFILVMIVPIIYFLFTRNKLKNLFFKLGFRTATLSLVLKSFLIGILLALFPILLVVLDDQFYAIFKSGNLLSGSFPKDQSIAFIILYIFIISYIKTALTEEIFFRGFLGKLLLKKLTFTTSNFIQSTIFGTIHLLFSLAISNNLYFILFSFIYPFIFSFIGFYLNEKKANGSILPSIIIHGTANFIFYSVVYFI